MSSSVAQSGLTDVHAGSEMCCFAVLIQHCLAREQVFPTIASRVRLSLLRLVYNASAQELSVADPVENGTDYDLELSQSSFVLPKLQRLAIAAQPFKMSLPALTKLTGLRELYVGGARWCDLRPGATH